MDAALRQRVWDRAGGTCEYCGMPDDLDPLPLCVDHVIARQHNGPSVSENLALSCFNCNTHKGPNIAGIDPSTGLLIPLFHPREEIWSDHFEWAGPMMIAKTDIGRVTLYVLKINDPVRLEHRRLLIKEGVFPRQTWRK